MLALARALMAQAKTAAARRAVAGPCADRRAVDLRALAELKATGVAMLLVEQSISLALGSPTAPMCCAPARSASGLRGGAPRRLRKVAAAYLGARADEPLALHLPAAHQCRALGSLYALVAIGLSMVFGILRMANFAHGDMMMVGAFATLVFGALGVAFLVAALAGVVVGALAGMIVERWPTARCAARRT